MAGAGSGYEGNAFTFSPDGRLFQVEYATKAVDKETITIGVRCSDGVLLAVEKPFFSPLLTPGSNSRIYWVDSHIACATCGYRPDSYAAVVRARDEARYYFNSFGEAIPVPELVARLAFGFHQAHGFSTIRPYGCGLIFASTNALYTLDPSGQYFGWFAACFGKETTLTKAELQKTEWGKLTVAEAAPIVGKIISGLPKPPNKKWEIEMMWVSERSGGKPENVPASLFSPPAK
jgi:20S proteasome subunit alpha 7